MTSTAEGSSVHEPDEDPSDRPTAPLDAVANLRLLGEVQRRGLEAANLVIERLTERTNAATRDAEHADRVDPMSAMAEAVVESVAVALAAMAPGVGPQSRSAASADDRGRPEVLSARGAPGERVEVGLWMHNYTDDLATGIEIHLSDLVSADGSRLAPSCVTAQPDRPFDLSAASSRPVQLTLDLPPDTSAGRYRGVLTASHLTDLWLVLEVDVPEIGTGPATPGEPPVSAPPDPTP